MRCGRLWEALPWSRVERNIRELVGKGVRELEFVDHDFFGGTSAEHLERARSFVDLFSELRRTTTRNLTFRVFARPDMLWEMGKDARAGSWMDSLLSLKQAGLTRIYVGIESGSASQLKRYGRASSPDMIRTVLKMLRRLGVRFDAGFIPFDPDVTLDEIEESLRFFRQEGLLAGNQWPFRPLSVYEGSPVCARLRREGRLAATLEELDGYPYKFADPRVARMHEAVDTLSAKTRSTFYALKMLSKKYFDPQKRDREASLAEGYVRRNGAIYLDLLFALLRAAKEDRMDSFEPLLKEAEQRIARLVEELEGDIDKRTIRSLVCSEDATYHRCHA